MKLSTSLYEVKAETSAAAQRQIEAATDAARSRATGSPAPHNRLVFQRHLFAPTSGMTSQNSFASLLPRPTTLSREDKRVHRGRVVFGAMDEVVFGEPAAEAVPKQMDRLGASRAFLMVSGTLRRQTDEIAKIERALGDRCAAIFDEMPQHTPREAVIAASEMARAAKADVIITVGGGSITDGAKAVQICLANDIRSVEAIDQVRA